MSTRKTPRTGPARNPIKTAAAMVATQEPRITPRNSDGDEAVAATAARDTPYETLRRLANIPKPTTPLRRAPSAGPPSGRSTYRTPIAQARTPGVGQPVGGSARRQNALTPHGRAAMREVEARRAGLTPGKDRRRSGRQQRETPRDDLRALSRLLAPKTKPTVPTPPGPKPARLGRDDNLDDGPELERPRLSLPIGEGDDDEDESLLLPPRSAGLEDENFTVESMEFPRRAVNELPPGRLSRGSSGSITMSGQFADYYGPRVGDTSFAIGGSFSGLADWYGPRVSDYSFAVGGAFGDDDILDADDDLPRDNTATLRDIGLGRGRVSLGDGRDRDIRGQLPDDDADTFVFTIPPRDVPEPQPQPSSENPDSFMIDNEENNDWEEVEDPVDSLLELPAAEGLDQSEVQDDVDVEMEIPMPEETLQDIDTSVAAIPLAARKKRTVKVSKHGIQYPSLPPGVAKKLATTYARTGGSSKAKISKDTLEAIMQATDWFFEQVSDDLGAYAKHAGRKTIDESDVVTLMKRQRQTNATTTPFSLAQKLLPRELLQELRMVPPAKRK